MPSWIPDTEHSSWGHQWIPFPEAEDIREAPFHGHHPIPCPRYSFITYTSFWTSPSTDNPLSGPPGCIPKHWGGQHLAGVRQGASQGCPPSGTHSLEGTPPIPAANKMGVGDKLSRTKHINGHEVAGDREKEPPSHRGRV